MKVIITESILKKYSQDILSPSKDHPTFAKITENDAMLWSDFGQDLALKVFKLSKDDLIALCGKNNRNSPNGQINWYKVDRAGFIMTQTTTFGFNITTDPLQILCNIVDEYQQYHEKEIDDYLNDIPILFEEEKTELKNLAKKYAADVENFIKSVKN